MACILHDSEKDACKATTLYCFDPDPDSYTQCIALNCAYNLGVIGGINKCTNRVKEFREKMEKDNESYSKDT